MVAHQVPVWHLPFVLDTLSLKTAYPLAVMLAGEMGGETTCSFCKAGSE